MNETRPEHLDQFEGFIRKWQPLLGLSGWRVVRSFKQHTKGCMACVKLDLAQRKAAWTLGASFGAEPVTPHSLEQTAVHELLHAKFAELIAAVKLDSPELVESVEHEMINLLERLLVPPQS